MGTTESTTVTESTTLTDTTTTMTETTEAITEPVTEPPAEEVEEESEELNQSPAAVVSQIEQLLDVLRSATSQNSEVERLRFGLNRQKRSVDKFARLKGERLLKVLNKIVKELQKLRVAVLSSQKNTPRKSKILKNRREKA